MMAKIIFLVCMFTLSLTACATQENSTAGKKKFDETQVRKDVDTANEILQILRKNLDMMETTDGIVKLCDKMRMKFTATEGNEIFKAAIISKPNGPDINNKYPEGLYYVCPTHFEHNLKLKQAPINAKYFDGTHAFWDSYGESTEVCDVVPGAPFFYSYSNSLIQKVAPPKLSPSIYLDFPFVASDEVRSLGLIPGLGDEFNNIYVAVGGEYPDVYQHQLVLLPVKKELCPDMVDPEINTFDAL